MGTTNLITFLGSIIVSLILGTTIAPSIIKQNENIKVDIEIAQKEKVLFDSIKKYILLENSLPTTMSDLTTKNYFLASNNTNGFGGSYTFTIDSTKGMVTINTNIADANIRNLFINTNKLQSKPVQGSGNTVSTTFILPLEILQIDNKKTNGIIVSDVSPSALNNKYWYDTTSGAPILKVSNGTNWKNISVSAPTSGGGGSSTYDGSAATTYGNFSNNSILNTAGADGEIKYVFDSEANQIVQYAAYNGQWFVVNSTSSNYKDLQFTNISLGFYHNCGVTIDSISYCWGAGNYAQLGSSTNTVYYPVKTNIPFKQITSGEWHGCGLTIDGTPYCWGYDGNYGTIGQNVANTIYNYNPLILKDSTGIATTLKFKSIVARSSSTCGIDSNDYIFCWGNNGYGQLGQNNTVKVLTPKRIMDVVNGDSPVKFLKVSLSIQHACGLMYDFITGLDGTAYCWGSNGNGQLGTNNTTSYYYTIKVKDSIGNDSSLKFKDIATGLNSTCAITYDGTPYCWGYNLYGQLGTNNTTQYSYPVMIKDSTGIATTLKFTKIIGGTSHYLGLTNDGTLYAWGYNSNGQLGDGTLINSKVPILVNTSLKFKEITAHGNISCATTINNVLYCWGNNSYGQFGNNTTTSSLLPGKLTGIKY